MVLENVKEMWTETPKLASGKKGRPVNKDRFISKMWVIKSLRAGEGGGAHRSSSAPYYWNFKG